jgi:hypothetical protein
LSSTPAVTSANADIIVPHHDWGFFDRHPSGIVGVPPASSE